MSWLIIVDKSLLMFKELLLNSQIRPCTSFLSVSPFSLIIQLMVDEWELPNHIFCPHMSSSMYGGLCLRKSIFSPSRFHTIFCILCHHLTIDFIQNSIELFFPFFHCQLLSIITCTSITIKKPMLCWSASVYWLVCVFVCVCV